MNSRARKRAEIVGRRSGDERLTTEATQRKGKRFAVGSETNGRDQACTVVGPNGPTYHDRRSGNGRLTTLRPKRKRQHYSLRVRHATDGFPGGTPATYCAAARKGASYRCAISLRTSWHYSQLRWKTRAAARRRGATGKLLLTATAQDSSAAVIQAGA